MSFPWHGRVETSMPKTTCQQINADRWHHCSADAPTIKGDITYLISALMLNVLQVSKPANLFESRFSNYVPAFASKRWCWTYCKYLNQLICLNPDSAIMHPHDIEALVLNLLQLFQSCLIGGLSSSELILSLKHLC